MSTNDDQQTFTLYSATWCGFCKRLKTQLTAQGITWNEIDVEQDPEAAAFVESVNDGNRIVPTLKYADGSTQTNPTITQVKQKLGL